LRSRCNPIGWLRVWQAHGETRVAFSDLIDRSLWLAASPNDRAYAD
jgi:hypothetical protein